MSSLNIRNEIFKSLCLFWFLGSLLNNVLKVICEKSFLFEPLDFATAGLITTSIRQCLGRFEPRIRVSACRAIPNDVENGFDVELTYKIIGTTLPPVTVDFFLARTR